MQQGHHLRLRSVTPTVQVGSGPVSLAVDQNTDTIYVANSGDNTVSVINGATCNGQNTSGCGQTTATVTVGSVPVALDVNQATDTVYVANWGNGTGTTVSVINDATCWPSCAGTALRSTGRPSALPTGRPVCPLPISAKDRPVEQIYC